MGHCALTLLSARRIVKPHNVIVSILSLFEAPIDPELDVEAPIDPELDVTDEQTKSVRIRESLDAPGGYCALAESMAFVMSDSAVCTGLTPVMAAKALS